MTRYLKILFLATLVIGLMAGSAFAQSQLVAAAKTIALEKTSTTATTRYPVSGVLPAAVTPVFQPDVLIANGTTITLTVANGIITTGGVVLCDAADALNASGTADGTATVSLTAARNIGGGTVLDVQSGTVCATATPFSDRLQINGGQSNGATVTLSVGPAAIAAGPTTLYTLTQQFTTTITPVTSAISFVSVQKGFIAVAGVPGSTANQSTAKLLLNRATIDDGVTLSLEETFTLRITGNLTGVASVAYNGVSAVVAAADVTAGFKEIPGVTGETVGTGGDSPLNITVNGTTTLTPRSFTVTFSTVAAAAPSEFARAITLLSAATSHNWILEATNIYLDLVGFNTAGTRETFIKIFSKTASAVTASVLASDGTMVDLDAGSIIPGAALTITGTELGAKVALAGNTVDGVAGFPVILSIRAPMADLFIFANIIDPSGAKVVPARKVISLPTVSGSIAGGSGTVSGGGGTLIVE